MNFGIPTGTYLIAVVLVLMSSDEWCRHNGRRRGTGQDSWENGWIQSSRGTPCDHILQEKVTPDSKVHVANMGPIWGPQDPGGPHVGPMNFAIWDIMHSS